MFTRSNNIRNQIETKADTNTDTETHNATHLESITKFMAHNAVQ